MLMLKERTSKFLPSDDLAREDLGFVGNGLHRYHNKIVVASNLI